MKAGVFENPFDHIATVKQQSAVRRERSPDELKKIIAIARGEDRLMIETGTFHRASAG